MATGSSNPTIRRRELARRLRELRQDVGKTVDEVAKELMCSVAKVSRMETGERGVQLRDLRDLCRFYGVSDAERDNLMQLAQDAARRGWWQDFRSLDQRVSTFVALETEALDMKIVVTSVLPGLLQTPEYTRCLLPRMRPPGEMREDLVEETVRLRALRQRRLHAGQVRLSAVVDESAFRRTIGSPTVMLDQLDRLLEQSQWEWVDLQIVPFTAGPHPGLEGIFQHLHLGGNQADAVFVEGLLGNFLIEDEEQVRNYASVFSYLSRDVALSSRDSVEWLEVERERWRRRSDGDPGEDS